MLARGFVMDTSGIRLLGLELSLLADTCFSPTSKNVILDNMHLFWMDWIWQKFTNAIAIFAVLDTTTGFTSQRMKNFDL